MTKIIKFYIGANNTSGEVEKQRAIEKGFTIDVYESMGYWEGKIEKSIVIEIIDDSDVEALAKHIAIALRNELEQNALLYTISDVGSNCINWIK